MKPEDFELMGDVQYDIAWCPGCGNYQIRSALMLALAELNLKPQETVIVSGIGQAAKTPHYVRTNVFNGLHGRALPAAMAIKAANPKLTVIAESGDGCMYGEGGNHLMHTMLRNPDITVFVHNNMVYGLTKGQASPTSQRGFETPVQTADRQGVTSEPFNPLALGVAMNASFVARALAGDTEQTKEIMKKAIQHKGFSLVDIFQPCVTYNKINTFRWFKSNTYYLDDKYDPTDRLAAFEKAIERDKYPLGVLYRSLPRATFEQNSGIYDLDEKPLFQRALDKKKLNELIQTKVNGL